MIGRKCHSTVPGVTKGELVEESRGPLCYASQHCWVRCFGKGSVQTVIPTARQRSYAAHNGARPIHGSGNDPTCRSRKPARKCRPTSLVGRQCETAQSTGDPDDPSARSPGQSSCLPPVIGVSGFHHHGTTPYPVPPQMPRCDSVQRQFCPRHVKFTWQ